MIPHVPGLRHIFSHYRTYRGLVVDLWGVMHNGQALFPAAISALRGCACRRAAHHAAISMRRAVKLPALKGCSA